MKIMHLEASHGWGGQEIRILSEAIGMREKGHKIFFAIEPSGKLLMKARQEGFIAYGVHFTKKWWLISFFRLVWLIYRHDIEIINTHSSLDAWLGGIVGKLLRRAVIRTRHLSTAIKKGWNSRILYHHLADFVVTTCKAIASVIARQSGKNLERCLSIPTGVNPIKIDYNPRKTKSFREKIGISETDFLVGMVCFMRSWKGIKEFMEAALRLKAFKDIKWVIIGGGHSDTYIRMAKDMGLEDTIIFTGHLDEPFDAINALDVFVLLSTANEGVSQASLQAAFLKKPLITTRTGGLKEVCLNNISGIQVDKHAPDQVVEAVIKLKENDSLRQRLGKGARELVLKHFTYDKMLTDMEQVYQLVKQ